MRHAKTEGSQPTAIPPKPLRGFLRQASLAVLICLLASCENKRDTNGDLGGMWQLTEWRDTQDSVVATNEQRIYYSFQLQLMKIQRSGVGTFLALFTHTPDSLFVDSVYSRPYDERVSFEDVSECGIPKDGKFRVDALSDSHLVLSSPEGTLTFRKY
ncbi:MAG: lipocalin-like domain-containing protein [Prevotellaceae bacterium]|nr:lipocalin-like domain-containing protein [Prevotellaceae bacterium]